MRLKCDLIVWCEKCNHHFYFDGYEKKQSIIKFLRQNDWAIGKKVLCPQCRETPQSYHIHF